MFRGKWISYFIVLVGIVSVGLVGCSKKDDEAPTPSAEGWTLEAIKTIGGFDAPECAYYDAATGDVYVANIETADKGYWVDDGVGFISVLSSDGIVKKMRWVDSSEDVPIHSPKGLAVLDGYLYFNDNKILKRFKIEGPGEIETIALPETDKLNDLASDGEAVWVTDVELSKVYRVDKEGQVSEIPAPEGINGITSKDGKVFAVSWVHHDLYELDAAGVNQPVAFGLAENFTNLDGIEVLDDGTFIVSDFAGGKICAVLPDRKTIRTLVELETPADIGIDRAGGFLYVPQLSINKLVIFKLEQK